jgi:predicted TIM-barrel fold metal-dependent hydrolase
MEIIDAQVHAWDADKPERPWQLNYADPARNALVRAHFTEHVFTMDKLIAAMDVAGVDAAIATVPSIYGYDNSYALDACARYPDRLAMIALVDPDRPDLDDAIQQLKANPFVLGLRVMIVSDDLLESVDRGSRRKVLAACQKHGLILSLYPPRYIQHVEKIARDFPDLRIVIDHLGHPQPPVNIAGVKDEPMFAGWDHLIKLAQYPNVSVKVTAFPSMSSQSYPYKDLWPRIHQLISVYGLPRLFWGTDFTRVHSLLSYAQGVDYVRESTELSASDKAALMGGSLRRYFNWPAPGWTPRIVA